MGTAALKGPGCLHCLAGTALSSGRAGKDRKEFLLLEYFLYSDGFTCLFVLTCVESAVMQCIVLGAVQGA